MRSPEDQLRPKLTARQLIIFLPFRLNEIDGSRSCLSHFAYFLLSTEFATILHHMVQYSNSRLDVTFSALSDATRRGVLTELGRGDASISKLAEQFHMSLTGMKKHVGILEDAGLVNTEKVGRVRKCKLGPDRLDIESVWIEKYRELWDQRFDALELVVQELKQTKGI